MCREEDQSTLHSEIILNTHYLLVIFVSSFHWIPQGWASSAHSFLHLFNQQMFTELYAYSKDDSVLQTVFHKRHTAPPLKECRV